MGGQLLYLSLIFNTVAETLCDCFLFFVFFVCVLQILVSHLEHDGRNFVIVGVESGLHSGQVFAQNCP